MGLTTMPAAPFAAHTLSLSGFRRRRTAPRGSRFLAGLLVGVILGGLAAHLFW
jgi:hypothetical protein